MQQKFEEANKRQEAKIRGLIQENNTLKTAKNGTDNKEWSHWTIQFESTPQLSGLTSPSGSTALSTRSSRLTSQVAKNFQRASPQNPQSPYLLFPEPMKIPIPLNPESIPAIPGGNENTHSPKSTESTPTIPGCNENTHTPARQY